MTTIQTIPPTFYEVAFNADPNQNVLPPYWTGISARVQEQWMTDRGRQYEFDINETGMWRTTLANADGALDPSNTVSPYAPGVVPYRQARIRCLPGPNLLTPDQATSGGSTPQLPGTPGMASGVTCDYNPYFVTTSASAYQGTRVWQTTGTTSPSGKNILTLTVPIPQVPGTPYSFSAQVRSVTAAANPSVFPFILWYNAAGTFLSGAFGSVSPLTGGISAAWTAVSVSGTVPAGAVQAILGAQLSTAPGGTWAFQVGAMQFEGNAFATPFQVPNTSSVNLLPRNIATGGLAAGSVAGWWFPAHIPSPASLPSVTYATGLLAAPTGHTNAVAWGTPVIGTTSFWPLLFGGAGPGPAADTVQVTAGTSCTFSCYALRVASADATLAVTPGIAWYTAAGVLLSTSTGASYTLSTGAWQRPIYTATAPAGAVWGRPQLTITTPTTTTAANTIYVTAAQFEAAPVSSAWQDPGTAYSIITPYVERWPQGWDELAGTYGTDDIQAVDAQAGLSQFTLQAPFVAEILALNPNFFYQLNDPLGSTSCVDTAGRRVPAPVENGPFGAGSLVFGNPVTATAVPSGGFQGSPGPIATFANSSNGGSPFQFPETYISLHKTAAVPGPPVSSAFTRIVAFRCSVIPPAGTSDQYNIWFGSAPTWTAGTGFIRCQVNFTTGTLSVTYSDSVGGGFVWNTGPNVCDGNWHLLAFGVDPGSGSAAVWLDGASVATASGIGPAGGYATDVLGAQVLYGSNQYRKGLVGDLAHAIELPLLVSNTQMTNLYNSWRTASSGESSGARASRVLTWIGWTGPAAIDTGMTASMGPATDLTGATALDALNNIALTENGNFFVDRNGTLTFKARNSRYAQTTPVYTFGENTAGGEWPFEYLHLEDDPSHIVNSAQVTQYQGPTVTANDAASRLKNFPRTYQRTINTTSLPECSDAAAYLLAQNKTAHLRADVVRLHPSAVPGLFQVCLNLDLGTRIRINRRPTGAPQITFDGFVEKIEWSWDPDGGEVYVTLQCSPADLTKYWLLGALHTTLHALANSGASTITIDALPDAAVNVLRSSLPSQYQLVIDPGTAIAETVTLQLGGIPVTSLGYSTAVLTLSGTLAHTHQAGAIVCEPLPAGVTDPTTWDTSSVLGATYVAITSTTAPGASTVTVGPLPDSAVNALGSVWNVGDVVWLGSGTGRFEAATIASVSTTYPGYTSATITFQSTLGFSKFPGDFVSDPLANSGVNPSTVSATARLAY